MVAPVASTPGVHYAPEDPTLPPPWKALVDEETGYLYYWNTQSNETTYVKPVSSSGAPGFSVNGSTFQESSMANGHVNGSNGSLYGSKVAEQPKLAALSMFGGQSQVVNGGSNAALVPGALGGYKRNADNFDYNGRDAYKRPRTQTTASPFDVDSYRRQHEITIVGTNVPAPFITFESAGLPDEVLREVQLAGFTAPTPIQAQSWPIALNDRDIVAIAKTGSGKTLGYLLPAFMHLERRRNNPRSGPTVLVLAPTRELATQIHEEAVKFGRSSRITSTCVYGGASKGPQLRDIERGCDIVIATPGRLNDFLEMRRISLRQVSYLVLDEADRMLDMGFEPQIRKIVNEVPVQRQTLMYTATWPKEVRKIAGDLLMNPIQVNIGNTDDLAANKAITQCVEVVSPQDKARKLELILRTQEPGSKIIIFCSTKRMCDQLARSLRRDFGAVAIHGDKSQGERDWVLSQFKAGKSPVLVATDVAARGLDIKDIRVVINYDFPTGVEDYVHRIGRTGRAGATGLAHTFFAEQDGKYARDLIKVLEGANQKVPPELREMALRGGFGKPRHNRWESGGGRGGGGAPANSFYGNRRASSWGGGAAAATAPLARFPVANNGAIGFENGDVYRRGYGERISSGKRSYSRSRSRSPNARRSRGRSRSPPGGAHGRFPEGYGVANDGGSGW
ncbi:ATP-dependent RNA helicase-like protein DB10 [Selaginella moellendorffii]|uniref:ATP-dependent RNA helicase-like protein DB10 n=1 Tax=Selaginella moellendorffii TaxID=88036 RepID=UPI000D1CF8B0|nr:ATP-dependent RNA helicase-like protein DB10 [Selaginella moellendorffii]XP_024530930.1 ATP-dependent RNA helicase-like protein DB10 [Selaginella moellendorffii]|eukprot:XP_024530928.1 ATP-dependent RNA helicase-like protein DB10 [Selaginella moellendorffii]